MKGQTKGSGSVRFIAPQSFSSNHLINPDHDEPSTILLQRRVEKWNIKWDTVDVMRMVEALVDKLDEVALNHQDKIKELDRWRQEVLPINARLFRILTIQLYS